MRIPAKRDGDLVGFKAKLEKAPVIGTALAVQNRYTKDAADPLAAAIGFFGFLSLFPLILLAVSVAGFVLQDPQDQLTVAATITEAIPGFEATMQDDDSGVEDLIAGVVNQRGTIGIIGLATLLLSGLRIINAAMISTRVVFRGAVMSGVGAKVRQVAALVGLGVLALAGAAGSSIAAIEFDVLPASGALLISVAVTFLLDFVLFLAAYKLLSPTVQITVKQLVPGAVLAAIGWTALKVAGSAYVGNQVESANALYGALGGVIALMLLMYLAGRLYLYGAELSAVLIERRNGPMVPPEDDDGSKTPKDAGVAAAAQKGTRKDKKPSAGKRRAKKTSAATSADPAAAAPGPRDEAASVVATTKQRRFVAANPPPQTERDTATDAQRAVGFALGVGALIVAWRFFGAGRSSDD